MPARDGAFRLVLCGGPGGDDEEAASRRQDARREDFAKAPAPERAAGAREIFRPVVPTLANPHEAWLTLAMATTLAGNLTLLGSVANLIVAEIARARGVHLSFVEYLKAGTLIAVLTLLIGVAWLSV